MSDLMPSTRTELVELVTALVTKHIDDVVEEKVAKEEDKRLRQLKAYIAFVGVIGLGTFGTLGNFAIERAVESRVERYTGNISDAVAFSKFYTLSLKVDLGTSFTQQDVDATLNYLRRIQSNAEVRRSPEFIAALAQITKAFVAATQSASIDEIFGSYEREMLTAPICVETLLHHYGQEIVSREADPKDDFAYRAFEKLERAAESADVPELALVYRTLYEARQMQAGPQPKVAELIRRSLLFKESERQAYLRTLFIFSRAKNWVTEPRPDASKVESSVRALFATYAREWSGAYGVPVSQIDEIAQQGVDKMDAMLLASRLSSGAKT